MSRAAGTLITTNEATYIDPRFMPGYRGHIPSKKFDYGETYGNETAKYFQDYRSAVLNSSSSPYNRGGSFPTFYSHNPEIVISNRSRGRDRYLDRVHYEMYNVDFDRSQELKKFDSTPLENTFYMPSILQECKHVSVQPCDIHRMKSRNIEPYPVISFNNENYTSTITIKNNKSVTLNIEKVKPAYGFNDIEQ